MASLANESVVLLYTVKGSNKRPGEGEITGEKIQKGSKERGRFGGDMKSI